MASSSARPASSCARCGCADGGRRCMRPVNDLTSHLASDASALRVVGVPTKHDSAVRHVAGSAVYVDDVREPTGTLHLSVGGTPAARGRITRLDLEAVK